jgi:dihydropteroate synthase
MNIALLARLRELEGLGRPILVGASRKSFIGRLTGRDAPAERLAGSLAAAALAVANGASIIRAHDVRPTVDAVAVAARFCARPPE